MKPLPLVTSPQLRPRIGASGARWPTALRVRVRVGRWRLDRDLADGVRSDASERHALRASQLSGAPVRRDLADSLRRVVAGARSPRSEWLSASVPVARDAVLASGEALLGLAERLEKGPAGACGVARARILLSDGAGPLYNRAPERSLTEAVWWIADGLQQCPPYDRP